MLSLLLILIGIIGVINISNYVQIQVAADDTLAMLADNDGLFPDIVPIEAFGKKDNQFDGNKDKNNDKGGEEGPPEFPFGLPQGQVFNDKIAYNRSIEMPYMSRYFWVKMDESGKVSEINTGHIAAIDSSAAEEAAKSVFDGTDQKSGYYDRHYRYIVRQMKNGDYIAIFLDCSNSFFGANQLFRSTLLIGAVALVAMFILVYLFSGKAVAPVVESLEKQKRFITDAGHELKTPLSVISANVDVIELESGKSEWTKSIKGQIKRMNGLVKNMLTLSRMEEENIHLVFGELNVSPVIKENAESFTPIAESKNLKMDINAEEDVFINGDKNAINQLSSILMDNALKYASNEGSISVVLEKDQSKKHVIFEVSNTCDQIPEGNLDKLFDRFYRADSSRSRETGGYGIGLSVARAIATSHGGTIEALKNGDHVIRFVVKLPTIKKK